MLKPVGMTAKLTSTARKVIEALDPLAACIRELVEPPADQLVALYFDPLGPFAAVTFDALPENLPNAFSTNDLLAVTLLDVRLNPQAVRALLQSGAAQFGDLLEALPADVDLWNATADDLRAAGKLLVALDLLPGVGETRATKLMARKRPRLMPIVDSVIRNALPLGLEPFESLGRALTDPRLRKAIEATRPVGSRMDVISTLRLMDVAVWIQLSASRAAIKARRTVSLGAEAR
jgi:hypothetical protein